MKRLRVIIVSAISLVLVHLSTGVDGERNDMGQGSSFCSPFPGTVLRRDKIERFENGSLAYDDLVYPAGSYQVVGNETYGCTCDLRLCLWKCCKGDDVLGIGSTPNCTRPNVVRGTRVDADIREMSGIDQQFVLVEEMDCPGSTLTRYMLEPEFIYDDVFELENDGTLRTVISNYTSWNYCLDWKESAGKIVVLVCEQKYSPVEGKEKEKERQKSYNVGIMVSIVFLLATFFVYAFIPELRNLYGKTLMCYVACLLNAYAFLVSTNFFYFSFFFCASIAFITHFSFVASFFWLNVMCFDIWWTFGGFRALHGSVKQRERKKFLIYSIYAWGCASLLTGVCAIMDLTPGIPDSLYKPGFGEQKCWFTSEESTAIYFYGPVSVTIFCNILLFASTALKIMKHKRDTSLHLGGADSRRHDDNKQRFNLYLKLFIVMGINWSMEVISWAFKWAKVTAWVDYLWYITDLTNALQGVIIFIIFVWKEKIRQLLLRRFNCYGRNVLSRNSTRSAYHSSAASRTYTTSTAMS